MLMKSLFALGIEINTVRRANVFNFTISCCKGQVISTGISTILSGDQQRIIKILSDANRGKILSLLQQW
jgi:predicted small secreted protein